ncbi:SRPBCC family protein [Chloroflexota bacterium]
MSKITKSIIINAPKEKVFEYMSNPENMLEWNPSITGIRDVTGRGELQRWIWDYKMMGLAFTGKAEVTRSTLNTDRVVKSTGGILSTWTWRLKSEAGGTRLELEIDYTIPIPVLGKVGEMLIVQRNERVINMAMANIKEKMEG